MCLASGRNLCLSLTILTKFTMNFFNIRCYFHTSIASMTPVTTANMLILITASPANIYSWNCNEYSVFMRGYTSTYPLTFAPVIQVILKCIFILLVSNGYWETATKCVYMVHSLLLCNLYVKFVKLLNWSSLKFYLAFFKIKDTRRGKRVRKYLFFFYKLDQLIQIRLNYGWKITRETQFIVILVTNA